MLFRSRPSGSPSLRGAPAELLPAGHSGSGSVPPSQLRFLVSAQGRFADCIGPRELLRGKTRNYMHFCLKNNRLNCIRGLDIGPKHAAASLQSGSRRSRAARSCARPDLRALQGIKDLASAIRIGRAPRGKLLRARICRQARRFPEASRLPCRHRLSPPLH